MKQSEKRCAQGHETTTWSAWIALSATGQPAFFLGMARTRKELAGEYAARFNHDIERAGYELVQVRMTPQRRRKDRAHA